MESHFPVAFRGNSHSRRLRENYGRNLACKMSRLRKKCHFQLRLVPDWGMRRFRKGDKVKIVCKKRLTLTAPPRTRELLFDEIKGWASAVVLISMLVPFNDPSYSPLQNGARKHFQSRLGPNWTLRWFRGGNIVKIVCKKSLRLTKLPRTRTVSFLKRRF